MVSTEFAMTRIDANVGGMPQPGPQFQALPQPGPLPVLPRPADAPEGAPAGEAQPGVSLEVSPAPEPLNFPDT